ncbi:MAG: zinc-binding dehydrogenase [Tepidisphaeraceae bacterium]
MRSWLLDKIGSLDLRLDTLPEPKPAPGEVVLEMLFAALNPADRYLAEGAYPARPALPHVLGRDGVGVVTALGQGVAGVRVGDTKVIVRGETGVSRQGTFAERVAVSADSLVDVPSGWSLEQAAGATLVYLTAYQAITQWPGLPAKSVTLVTGASGGVGVASIQLAKAMGHTVVALTRGIGKHDTLRSIGADIVLDVTVPTWRKQLDGRKVNLAIDNVGGEGFNDLLGVMDYAGRISVVGRLAGPVPQFNTASLFFRRLQIGGVAVGTYSRFEAIAAWDQVQQLMAQRGAKPLVDQVFAFEQLNAAFERLRQGPIGKVLLRVKA